jgi:hypothetical protein
MVPVCNILTLLLTMTRILELVDDTVVKPILGTIEM